MTKFCTNCGMEVKEDANFCPKCGFNFNEIEQTENKLNSSANIGTKSKKGFLSFLDDWNEWSAIKKAISIIVVCCIGLVIIGAIGSILSPDANTSTDSSSSDDSNKVNRYDSYTGGSSSDSNENSNPHSSDTSDDLGDSDVQVRITCKGGWSGAIGVGTSSSTYSGKGDEVINLDGSSSDIVSVAIQKQSGGNGKLKVEIIKNGKVVKEASTTSGYGVVSVAD